MDKNTILGLLLMGAVIFGFMYINKPTEEQIEQQRREQLERQQAADEVARRAQEEAVRIDTLSGGDIESLRNAMRLYGTVDSTSSVPVYRYSTRTLSLELSADSIRGTIATSGAPVDAARIIAGDLSGIEPARAAQATRALHSAIADLGRYKNFASHLNGDDTAVTLENDMLAVELSSKGGQISRVELKNYECHLNDTTGRVVLWDKESNDYSFTLSSANQRFATADFYFTPEMSADSSSVMMKLDLGAGAWWGIRYSLAPGSYLVKMDVVQHGMEVAGIIPTSQSTMDFTWHQRMRRNEEGKMFEERNSAIYYKALGDDVNDLSSTSDAEKQAADPLKWIAFKNQFFSSVLIPDGRFNSGSRFTSTVLSDDPVYLKDMRAVTQVDYSTSRDSIASFNFFLGPNLYPLLSSLDEKISPDEDLEMTRLIPLGWSLFRWINTIIIIPIFTFLGKYIGSYGVIILVLTIIVKIILFPFTYKSYMSQARMRVLSPEIKEINAKYPGKENAMIRQQKTMQLYSSAGANPMSGCLPMLLQLPILIAMFSFFPSCIELRGEPFLWAHDLSAPDSIISWSTNIPLISSSFGNHISLFCLLMTVTNILYTRINMQNQPTSEGMPGMKLMMYAMPLIFLFWFNNYASGLSYYYFLSLLITIVQTYVFRKVVNEQKVRETMLANTKKPRKKSGFMARLEEAQRKQQAALREQQKRNRR